MWTFDLFIEIYYCAVPFLYKTTPSYHWTEERLHAATCFDYRDFTTFSLRTLYTRQRTMDKSMRPYVPSNGWVCCTEDVPHEAVNREALSSRDHQTPPRANVLSPSPACDHPNGHRQDHPVGEVPTRVSCPRDPASFRAPAACRLGRRWWWRSGHC